MNDSSNSVVVVKNFLSDFSDRLQKITDPKEVRKFIWQEVQRRNKDRLILTAVQQVRIAGDHPAAKVIGDAQSWAEKEDQSAFLALLRKMKKELSKDEFAAIQLKELGSLTFAFGKHGPQWAELSEADAKEYREARAAMIEEKVAHLPVEKQEVMKKELLKTVMPERKNYKTKKHEFRVVPPTPFDRIPADYFRNILKMKDLKDYTRKDVEAWLDFLNRNPGKVKLFGVSKEYHGWRIEDLPDSTLRYYAEEFEWNEEGVMAEAVRKVFYSTCHKAVTGFPDAIHDESVDNWEPYDTKGFLPMEQLLSVLGDRYAGELMDEIDETGKPTGKRIRPIIFTQQKVKTPNGWYVGRSKTQTWCEDESINAGICYEEGWWRQKTIESPKTWVRPDQMKAGKVNLDNEDAYDFGFTQLTEKQAMWTYTWGSRATPTLRLAVDDMLVGKKEEEYIFAPLPMSLQMKHKDEYRVLYHGEQILLHYTPETKEDHYFVNSKEAEETGAQFGTYRREKYEVFVQEADKSWTPIKKERWVLCKVKKNGIGKWVPKTSKKKHKDGSFEIVHEDKTNPVVRVVDTVSAIVKENVVIGGGLVEATVSTKNALVTTTKLVAPGAALEVVSQKVEKVQSPVAPNFSAPPRKRRIMKKTVQVKGSKPCTMGKVRAYQDVFDMIELMGSAEYEPTKEGHSDAYRLLKDRRAMAERVAANEIFEEKEVKFLMKEIKKAFKERKEALVKMLQYAKVLKAELKNVKEDEESGLRHDEEMRQSTYEGMSRAVDNYITVRNSIQVAINQD